MPAVALVPGSRQAEGRIPCPKSHCVKGGIFLTIFRPQTCVTVPPHRLAAVLLGRNCS